MNKIKDLFDVDIGEEFYLRRSYEKTYTKDKYHFNNKGYLIKENSFCSSISPSQIVQGHLVIVKIPNRENKGELK